MRLTKSLKTFLVLLTLTSFLSTSLASPPSFARLKKGEPTPFDSSCFDLHAAAQLLADKETEPERCQLKIDTAISRQKAEFTLKMGKLQVEYEYYKSVSGKKIQILKVENKKLEALALKQPNSYWYVFVSAGFLAGVVSSILIVEAVN